MKKIIPYILILIIVAGAGFFIQPGKASAQACTGTDSNNNPTPAGCIGTCQTGTANAPVQRQRTKDACDKAGGKFFASTTNSELNSQAQRETTKSELETVLSQWDCGFLFNASFEGCFVKGVYYIFYVPTSLLLGISAVFFNTLISISLSSKLFTEATFIKEAWGIIRDFSNIFFILILLYVAIKLILGLAGHGAKQMIGMVVLMALLINFSMFATKIVIDSSNILALIFYNKLDVQAVNAKGEKTERPYSDPVNGAATGVKGKDITGAIKSAFDPTKLFTPEFFQKTREIKVMENGVETKVVSGKTPSGMVIGLLIVYGVVTVFAAYAFFIAGLSFLGRLIELWMLIIFSPFAFMSFTIPILSSVEHVGWSSWLKRLLSASFMAPIFMFLMYLIFLLVEKPPLDSLTNPNTGLLGSIIIIILPAAVILTLLMIAVSYAKKGAGKAGEMAIKAGSLGAGLAAGVATGGAAFALRGVVGGGGGFVANKLATGANKLGLNKVASGLTRVGALAQKSNFDIRGTKLGSAAFGAAGLKGTEALMGINKGGIEQARKEKVEKKMKRADELKVREDEGLKQKLNNSEIDLQVMLNKVAQDFGNIDRELESLRKAKADTATGSDEEKKIAKKIEDLNNAKKAVKTGGSASYEIDGVKKTINAVTINRGGEIITMKKLASEIIPGQKEAIEAENRRRKIAFANRTANWRHWGTANKEAKHKIIMGEKLPESGAKA